MIKARGKRDGREFVLFGLSHANLDRLREGRPILFDGRPYGVPMDVLIMAGATERALANELNMASETPFEVHVEKDKT